MSVASTLSALELMSVALGFAAGLLGIMPIIWLQRRQRQSAQDALQKAATEHELLKNRIGLYETQTQGYEDKIQRGASALMEATAATARLTAEKEALAVTIAQREKDLLALEQRFTLQFENLANRIFEDKANKFKQDSQSGLEQTLAPLRENLQAFQKKVDESFGMHAREQHSLQQEIARIVNANEKITIQAENLANALKGESKVQGDWGEIILEKILEDSGLRKDIDYIVQGMGLGMKHVEDGRSLKPDVIVNLPDQRHIIVDSKVSLTHYERYFGEADPAMREEHFRAFLGSLREHVNGLAKRRYQDVNQGNALDTVLMFVPIEGALIAALQRDPELHNHAWKQRIAIVCPTTLFATLRTIESMWRLDRQNKNAEEIARKGGDLYDKFVGFIDDMTTLGDRLESTRKAYDGALGKLKTGRGNIMRRAEEMKQLGVKTSKQIPASLLQEEDDITDTAAAEALPPRTAAQ